MNQVLNLKKNNFKINYLSNMTDKNSGYLIEVKIKRKMIFKYKNSDHYGF